MNHSMVFAVTYRRFDVASQEDVDRMSSERDSEDEAVSIHVTAPVEELDLSGALPYMGRVRLVFEVPVTHALINVRTSLKSLEVLGEGNASNIHVQCQYPIWYTLIRKMAYSTLSLAQTDFEAELVVRDCIILDIEGSGALSRLRVEDSSIRGWFDLDRLNTHASLFSGSQIHHWGAKSKNIRIVRIADSRLDSREEDITMWWDERDKTQVFTDWGPNSIFNADGTRRPLILFFPGSYSALQESSMDPVTGVTTIRPGTTPEIRGRLSVPLKGRGSDEWPYCYHRISAVALEVLNQYLVSYGFPALPRQEDLGKL